MHGEDSKQLKDRRTELRFELPPTAGEGENQYTSEEYNTIWNLHNIIFTMSRKQSKINQYTKNQENATQSRN